MKVTKITTAIVRVPLAKDYVFATHSQSAFQNVLVFLETDEGVRGIGEASFSGMGGGVYPETPETAKVAIDKYLAPHAVVGRDPFDIEGITHEMDLALPGNLVAKSGIDLALWDAMGKAVGKPAAKLLGGE